MISLLFYNCSNQNYHTVEISENWQFKNSVDSTWLKATVPGTVHTDLISNSLIEDPFYYSKYFL